MSNESTHAANSHWLSRLVGHPFVWMHVACNGDQGMFEGKAWKVEIALLDGERVTFESKFINAAPACSVGDNFVRIAGLKVQSEHRQFHVGNWCWDAWKVKTDDAGRMLTSPRFTKWMQLDEWTEEFETAWRDALPNTEPTRSRGEDS